MIKRYIAGLLLIAGLLFVGGVAEAQTPTLINTYAWTSSLLGWTDAYSITSESGSGLAVSGNNGSSDPILSPTSDFTGILNQQVTFKMTVPASGALKSWYGGLRWTGTTGYFTQVLITSGSCSFQICKEVAGTATSIGGSFPTVPASPTAGDVLQVTTTTWGASPTVITSTLYDQTTAKTIGTVSESDSTSSGDLQTGGGSSMVAGYGGVTYTSVSNYSLTAPVLTTLSSFTTTGKQSFPNVPLVVTGITGSGTVATGTLSTAETLPTGYQFLIAGSSIAGFNGTQVITSSGTSSTTFTFASSTSGTGAAPASITAQDTTNTSTAVNVSALTCNATTGIATATVSSTSSMADGDNIAISYANPPGLNGQYTISVISSTQFTYANTTSSAGATPSITAQQYYYPGLGQLNGSGTLLPAGPRFAGDSSANSYGWSIGTQDTPYSPSSASILDLTSTAVTGLNLTAPQQHLFAGSEFIDSSSYFINGQSVPLFRSQFSDGTDAFSIGFNYATGNFESTGAYPSYGSVIDSGVSVPANGVFYQLFVALDCLVQAPSGNASWNEFAAYRVAGSSTWVTIFNNTNVPLYYNNGLVTKVQFGPGGTASYMNGRWGAPQLFALSQWSDASPTPFALSSLTPAVNDPKPYGGYTWYFDPAQNSGTASDTNTGVSSSTALLTPNAVTQLAEFGGFIAAPYASSWQKAIGGSVATVSPANAFNTNVDILGGIYPAYVSGSAVLTGDQLIVNNNNGAEIRLPEQVLDLATPGITVKSSGGTSSPATLSRFHIIPVNTWTFVSGGAYSNTDSSPITVVFENRRCMTLASSLSTCESTPGSFFVGSGLTYVNPFGSTNPNTDGNLYERTLDGVYGFGGINFSSPCFLCQGISTLGNITTTDNGAYSFGDDYQTGSLGVFDTCAASYGDKHIFATVGSVASNARTLYLNCIAEGENPYGSFGASTSYVDFVTTGSGNESGYYNCTTGRGLGMVVGSTLFSNNVGGISAWTCHGGTDAITTELQNCNIYGAFAPAYNDPISFNHCVLNNPGGTNGAIGLMTINNSIVNGNVFPNATCNNCIFPITAASGNWNNTAVLNNCTIDYTQAGSSNILTWQTASTPPVLTLNECLILAGTGALITALPTNGTANYHSNYCEWQSPASQALVSTVTNGAATLAQMQTQSLDTGSVSLNGTAASVTPGTYQRTAQSSLTKLIGPFTDYTGVNFAQRQTIGAYEWVASGGVGTTTIITGGSRNPNTPVHY